MPNSNIRKIVHIEVKPGQAEAARDALAQLEEATRREDGCVSFQFFQALSAPHSFLLIEDFRDRAALDVHMGQPHTRAFFARELVAAIRPVEPGWLVS